MLFLFRVDTPLDAWGVELCVEPPRLPSPSSSVSSESSEDESRPTGWFAVGSDCRGACVGGGDGDGEVSTSDDARDIVEDGDGEDDGDDESTHPAQAEFGRLCGIVLHVTCPAIFCSGSSVRTSTSRTVPANRSLSFRAFARYLQILC